MYSQIFITFLVVDGTHVQENNTYEILMNKMTLDTRQV